MKRFIILFLFTFSGTLFSQNETNNWYFGKFAGLSFSAGSPVNQSGSKMYAPEGTTVMSDPVSGALLFYSNGDTVWDASHSPMPNGTNLDGGWSSSMPAVAVPDPGNKNRYYLFTTDAYENQGKNGLNYHIIDMTSNGGKGDVVSLNNKLISPCTEQLHAIKHANCTDWWVITRHYTSKQFYVYQVTATGISAPIVSTNASSYSIVYQGCGKFSPNGKKYAFVDGSPDNATFSIANMHVALFDFDNTTGKLSNKILLPIKYGSGFLYGLSFSQDNSKLYFTEDADIYQYDVSSGVQATINASKYLVGSVGQFGTEFGHLQLAKDGKIYATCQLFTGASYLSVIHNPNGAAALCGYQKNALLINSGKTMAGLPVFPESFFDLQDPCNKFVINVVASALNCYNSTDGTATATPVGGTGPYTYSWSPTGGTDSIATGLAPGTYTVAVTDANNNSATQTVTITSPPALTLTLPPDQSICFGDSITLNASAAGGSPAYAYSWSHGDKDSTALVKPVVDTLYILEVSDKNGCKTLDTVKVKVVPGITALAGPNTTLCIGDSVQLSATGGSSYSWSPAAGLSNPNVSDPVASPTATTLYTVTVSSGSCAPATAQVEVKVVPTITANISPDTAICLGEQVTLTASGGSSYLWSPAATLSDSLSATVTASPLSTTSYSVTVTSGSCAPATNSVTITVNPKPITTISSSDTIQLGETILLSATGGTAYSWSPNTGLDDPTSDQPLASPGLTTTYTVTITDAKGCKATELVTIYVENDCDNAEPFLPNAFSPNGDGMNDNLELRTPNLECIVKYHLTIFNRWGEKVYDSTDPKEKWDGTYKSQPCDAAVFDYFLDAELIDGTLISRKGNVSLVR